MPGLKPTRRVRTPTVLQMEAVECGAASLAIVLGYYKCFIPLERLRVECGVSRDGSKASNIVKAARRFGMQAKGYKREPAELSTMRLPFIVFWNFNHFLVIEGFGKKWVYLNDPAMGPRKVSHEEFNDSFTGVVLTIEPGTEHRQFGRPKSFWRALRSRLRGSEGAITYVMLVSFALILPNLIIPSFIRTFVDQILGERRYAWILWLMSGMLGAAAMRGGLTFLQQFYLDRLETRMALTQSGRYLWHMLRLPVEFFFQRSAGDLGARVALNDRVASLLSGQLASAAFNVMTVVFYALIMAAYDRTLTGIVVALAGVNFVALKLSLRALEDAQARLQSERGKATGATMAGIRTMETLKATGRESDFFVRWSGYQAKLINLEQEQDRLSQVILIVPALATALGSSVVLAVGGLQVIAGAMTVGTLTAFQSLMASFNEPVTQMVGYGSELQQVRADMNRLDDVLSFVPEIDADEITRIPSGRAERLSGRIDMSGITFGYSPLDPPLIADFNLSLRPGQRVALVGSTGSGKSTVAKLICGLYQPWSGEIRFDGRTRAELPRYVLVSSIAHVDQEILLFSGTIRDNLTLWDTTVGDADIVRALQDAAMYERVMERPGGLDATVLEGGANFSGGERQRLEIARALVGNPSILVMDEATSALDPLVEKSIDERLRSRGCTCVIVAHRLSTIRDCDEIVVLERGQVVQRGIHDEMIEGEGAYRRLIEAELVKEQDLI